MQQKFRFFVGSCWKTERDGQTYYDIPRYYRDTRSEEDNYSRYSNIFTSSTVATYATKYDTYDEALAWRNEFLDDSPNYIIFREQA